MDGRWYWLKGNTRVGPFDRAALADKANSGELADWHLVWDPDVAAWRSAGEVPGLMGPPPPPQLAPQPDPPAEFQGSPAIPDRSPPVDRLRDWRLLAETNRALRWSGVALLAHLAGLLLAGCVAAWTPRGWELAAATLAVGYAAAAYSAGDLERLLSTGEGPAKVLKYVPIINLCRLRRLRATAASVFGSYGLSVGLLGARLPRRQPEGWAVRGHEPALPSLARPWHRRLDRCLEVIRRTMLAFLLTGLAGVTTYQIGPGTTWAGIGYASGAVSVVVLAVLGCVYLLLRLARAL